MSKTNGIAINARTISVAGIPIAGSGTPTGPYTTFDQLDESTALYLNGVLIQGTANPLAIITNYGDINVLSGDSLAGVVKYGTASTPATNAATGPLNPSSGSVTPTLTIPYASSFVGFGDSLISQSSNARGLDNPLAMFMFLTDGYFVPRPGSDQGIGGNRTDAGTAPVQMGARVQYTANQKADVVFMDGGINDLPFGTAASQVVTNLQGLFATIWTANPNAIIVYRAIHAVATDSYTAAKATINSAVQGMVNLTGTNRLIFVPQPANWNPATDLQSDNLHYNSSGAMKFAQATLAVLSPYMTTSTLYSEQAAAGYHGANVDTYTSLTGTSGTMTNNSTGTTTGTVATGQQVINNTSATVVCSQGTRNGQTSQVITISGTVSAAASVVFSQATGAAVLAAANLGTTFEHYAHVAITAADGTSAPVGLLNMWETEPATNNAAAQHFFATRLGTDNLATPVEGSFRSWSIPRRLTASSLLPLLTWQLAAGTVNIRIEIIQPSVRAVELLAYAAPYYLGTDGIKGSLEQLFYSGTVANGSTLTVVPGTYSGGALTFSGVRIYQGASGLTTPGTGTLLTTLAQGTFSWAETGLTSGQTLYLEMDISNTFGSITVRSIGIAIP